MKLWQVLIGTLVSSVMAGPAWAEVRNVWPTQQLERPAGVLDFLFGRDVAIDGGSIIVLAETGGARVALLYSRNDSTGEWSFRRTLLTVTTSAPRAYVRMKNGIAAVQFGNRVWLFEYINGNYFLAQTAAPIRHPGGLAISGNSILIGGNDCDYDAVVYQKGGDGLWDITGRLDDNQGPCRAGGVSVELDGDLALLRYPGTRQVDSWQRNGTLLDWVPTGSFEITPEFAPPDPVAALQGLTAVTPGHPIVFRRNGNLWAPRDIVTPVDYPNSTGIAHYVTYRDGVLLAVESRLGPIPQKTYAYRETSPGHFDHGAILDPIDGQARRHDVSGSTVVMAVDNGMNYHVRVFDLPSPLIAPPSIVNDFEDDDISDFAFSFGAFEIAARGDDHVLTRTDADGIGFALLADSDWSDQQRIEAEIMPRFVSPIGWMGLVAHFVSVDSYYYLAIRPDETFRLVRRLHGAETVLLEGPTMRTLPYRAALVVDGDRINVSFDDWVPGNGVIDRELRHGRAGLASLQARVDFDDVHAAATPSPVVLMEKDFIKHGNDYSQPFVELGGDWRVIRDEQAGVNLGIGQLDISGSALAFSDTPARNQEIVAVVRLDAYGPSQQGAWFGLLARFVDPRTHYYVTVRSTNLIQIRKQVNGVITVLGSANFTAVPGRDYHLRFRVINDELQLFLDNTLVASAHDDEIESGLYGIATYRATALYRTVVVSQP